MCWSSEWGLKCFRGGVEQIPRRNLYISWVGPPPTNSGILGMYKDLNMITITSCGHY